MTAAGLILQCRGKVAANSAAALPQARKYGEFVAARRAASLPQALAAGGGVRSTPLAAAHLDEQTETARCVVGELPTHLESQAAQMAMWIDITMSDGTTVYVRASGGYAPDVMNDLQNRARDLMTHAASLGLEVMKACNEMETSELDEADEVAE